ncbi:GspS/AspS pilotin family protein [Vibrio salinus]|uniref:GspS/AspS pilotin family protein n=1 Tax=Vibrio salinus TaxID=2899784 RepID=UPI001E294FD7|nr:GspS/AspS pilotin family protein [Vibrio salinus]MCE0492716.1 GspS/AspS pilotin family protein [Vibrio salinus]
MLLKRFIVIFLSLFIFACSSSSNEEKQLELLAMNRASLIEAELPIEVGPLHIMRASANKNIVEIMMIYNSDSKGAKPIKQVLAQSIHYYCSDKTTLTNLDIGLTYRIKMRNPRGQLMIDKIINKQTCEPFNRK